MPSRKWGVRGKWGGGGGGGRWWGGEGGEREGGRWRKRGRGSDRLQWNFLVMDTFGTSRFVIYTSLRRLRCTIIIEKGPRSVSFIERVFILRPSFKVLYERFYSIIMSLALRKDSFSLQWYWEATCCRWLCPQTPRWPSGMSGDCHKIVTWHCTLHHLNYAGADRRCSNGIPIIWGITISVISVLRIPQHIILSSHRN